MLNKELLSVYGFRCARLPTCALHSLITVSALRAPGPACRYNAAANFKDRRRALPLPRRYPILLTQCHMAACSTMAYGVALAGIVPRVPLKSRCVGSQPLAANVTAAVTGSTNAREAAHPSAVFSKICCHDVGPRRRQLLRSSCGAFVNQRRSPCRVHVWTLRLHRSGSEIERHAACT